MIRYKDKTFEQWSICPATGDIFDSKSGKVQDIILDLRGYANFKGMPVHRIMAYTFYGYKLRSEEIRLKISATMKGKKQSRE